ncbi:MAG: hypothetical protein ABEK01_02805 [Candidatus Nanohaloarchaea archaeon]
MVLLKDYTVRGTVETFVMAPVRNPEILPSLIPLIIGAVVLELYFGKYTRESLGWNTALANSMIWIATGATLLMNGSGSSDAHLYGAAFLLVSGSFVAIMDFFHVWPEWIAFRVSSYGLIYLLAYIIVVMAKTGMEVNRTTLEGAGIFFFGSAALLHVVRWFEMPRDLAV